MSPGLRFAALVVVAALVSPAARAWSVACFFGASVCITSQGTRITTDDAIELLDRCQEFTNGDLGSRALKMSYSEIAAASKGRATPLAMAWVAYDDIGASPLQFDRSAEPGKRYQQIKRACAQLSKDFDSQLK